MKAKTVVFNGIIELNGTIPIFITANGKTMFNSAPTDSGLGFTVPTTPIFPSWDSSPPEISSLSAGLSGNISGVSANPLFAYLPVNVGPMYWNPYVSPDNFLLTEVGAILTTEDGFSLSI